MAYCVIDDLISTVTSVLRTSLLYRSRIRNMHCKLRICSQEITFYNTICVICHNVSVPMTSYISSNVSSNISSLKHAISCIITFELLYCLSFPSHSEKV